MSTGSDFTFPIRVVGDVHGQSRAMAKSIKNWTDQIIFLGDLIDFGPDSASTLRRAVRLHRSGRAAIIRSNHDDKLYRHLIGNPVEIGVELEQTLHKINQARDAKFLREGFLNLYEQAFDWLRIGRYVLAHGAFHPLMLTHSSLDEITDRKVRSKVRYLAYYAEGKLLPGHELPVRTYNWIETIPSDLFVIVGHDIRSPENPIVVTNAKGGQAMFLDTGSGKGGRLTWVDLPEGSLNSVATSQVG